MGCDQCQNSLCQKTVHTSHIPTYSLKLGVCVLICWKQGVCIAEMGGMCCRNGGYVAVAEMGGMCCGNVGYVSVAEMGVCVVEMWGMYQLQKWGYVLWKCGVCISCRNGGMCCRNGGYVSVAEMGGMCCGNVGYVSVAEMGVCISCRNGGVCSSCRNGGMCCGNGGYVSVADMGGMCCGNVGYVSVAEMGVCVVEMYQLQKWGVCISFFLIPYLQLIHTPHFCN